MRTILLFAISCFLLIACGRKPKQQEQVKLPDFVNATRYYVQLKGTLSNKHITIQLMKTGTDSYTGYYYYDDIGEPIVCWGNINSIGKLELNENTSDEERFFTGVLDSAGNYTGKWRGKGTSYDFAVHPSMKDAVPLDVYYGKDSAELLPGRPNSPVGTATNGIIWPAATVDDSTAAFIRRSITGSAVHNDPERYLRRDIDSFLASYKTILPDLDTTEGVPQTANWSADADIKVVYNTYPYLVLENFSYEYTGGAHGNYGAIYQVLDLQKRKVLTPDDLFKPGWKTALIPYLEASYRKQYKLDDSGEPIEEGLLVKQITANNNFLITDKGIAFSFTPYEIGPYVMGQVTLFISFKDVKSLLK